jgi:hypothetical protein
MANTVSPAVHRLPEGLLGLGASLSLRDQFRLQPLVLGAKMTGGFDGFVTGEVGVTDLGLQLMNRCLRLGQAPLGAQTRRMFGIERIFRDGESVHRRRAGWCHAVAALVPPPNQHHRHFAIANEAAGLLVPVGKPGRILRRRRRGPVIETKGASHLRFFLAHIR